MILRAAIVFLLILNLAVAAWWLAGGNAQATKTVVPVTSLADVPPLRLLKEVVAAKPVVTVPDAESPVPAPDAVTAAAVVVPAATAGSEPGVSCLRFGPFGDAAARDALRPALQRLAGQVIPRETQGNSVRGWRVYMPPQASRVAAQALVENIKAAGINDWYIIANGDEANSIALGRYGSEASARRREAQLAAKGFIARAEPLSDTPPQWWLDARLLASASPAALAAIAPSKSLDCASLR